MTGLTDPQIGPAIALVQLISEHPVRPETVWTIAGETLHGFVYGPTAGGEQAVRWYADLLGCTPLVVESVEEPGVLVQRLKLTATWRDVPVEISATLEYRPVLEATEVVMSDGTRLTAAHLAVSA